MAEFEQIMRVQMDEKQLHQLLDPILQEVNTLRARVAKLEAWRDATHEWVEAAEVSITDLETFVGVREDDGK